MDADVLRSVGSKVVWQVNLDGAGRLAAPRSLSNGGRILETADADGDFTALDILLCTTS